MKLSHLAIIATLSTTVCLSTMSQAVTLVAVDVGHTLEKPGATSARGETEFNFNREMAEKVGQALLAVGFTAKPVGEDGKMKDLQARTDAAAQTDFFLSIHHDSMQPRYLSEWVYNGKTLAYGDRFSGFSLFVSRKNAHLSESLKCASTIGRALIHAGFKPSRHHAEAILGENRPFADKPNGVHYYDDLVVLKTAHQPAVLMETGIIVNRDDELMLRKTATREKIAKAVASALAVCLAKPAG